MKWYFDKPCGEAQGTLVKLATMSLKQVNMTQEEHWQKRYEEVVGMRKFSALLGKKGWCVSLRPSTRLLWIYWKALTILSTRLRRLRLQTYL